MISCILHKLLYFFISMNRLKWTSLSWLVQKEIASWFKETTGLNAAVLTLWDKLSMVIYTCDFYQFLRNHMALSPRILIAAKHTCARTYRRSPVLSLTSKLGMRWFWDFEHSPWLTQSKKLKSHKFSSMCIQNKSLAWVDENTLVGFYYF